MALGRLGSRPKVSTAGNDLVDSLSELVTATGRWLSLQAAAQEIPVYAERARQASSETLEHAGDWAGATAARAREATSDVAGTARTQTINLLLVAVLLWWVDRMLTGTRDR